MKRFLLLVLMSGCQFVLIFGCQFASASNPNLDEAEALLDAMRAKQSYMQAIEQFAPLIPPNTTSLQELYDHIYNEMARIYSEVYSATELQAMRKFFESPSGQAFLDKKPNPLQFMFGYQLTNEDETNLAEAEALLNVMRVRKTLGQVAGQSAIDSSIPNAVGSQDFNDNFYRGMVRAYAQVYTATELRQIREFFESPAGQAFLDKKPLLIEKYLEVYSEVMRNLRVDSMEKE